MRPLRFARLLIIAGILFSLLPTLTAWSAGEDPEPSAPISQSKAGKLSPRLAALAETPGLRASSVEAQAATLSLPASGGGSLVRDPAGRILVAIRTSDMSEASQKDLTSRGAQITHVSDLDIIAAYVAPEDLPAVAAAAGVIIVFESLAPSTGADLRSNPRGPDAPDIGAKTSEGWTQLRAGNAFSTYGVTGAAVRVGVLSDTYNQWTGAPTRANNDITSSDLPGTGNPNGFTTPLNVVAEGPSAGASDEGRAMLQIVHDIARGAQLSFATAFGSDMMTFADNIRRLRNEAGADIIVDDVSYYMEPFYQEGPVSVAARDVTQAGALYFTSAGNSNVIVGGKNVGSYEASSYRPMSCRPVSPADRGRPATTSMRAAAATTAQASPSARTAAC